jgi:MFS family permease
VEDTAAATEGATAPQTTERGGLLGWLLLASVLQLVLAMLALLCAAVVAVTAWHLPRSFTVAMVLGLLSGAVALGCIAVLLSTRKWQSGAWRWFMVVAVVVCGVGQLCGVALFGIDVADEEAPRERWALLATAAAVFVAVCVVAIAHCVVRFRLRHDVSVCNGMDSSLSWVL